MNFSVKKSQILEAISKIIGVIPSRSTISELENFLFVLSKNKLTITGTDSETFIITSLEVLGEKDGEILIPAKRLYDTLKNLQEKNLTFNVEDDKFRIKISSETGSFHPGGIDPKNYIEIPEISKKDGFVLNGDTLKELISNTIFAVSPDDLRPAMTGVFFKLNNDLITAVATDGHRLVKQTIKTNNTGIEKEFIVPTKALAQIEKFLSKNDAQVSINNEHISFKNENTELISRLIGEKYPNYNSVIPTDNNTKITTNKNEFIQAIKIVSLYSNNISHQIRLTLKKNKIKLSAEDSDFGGDANENISCDYSGDEIEIGFNANYLVDAISHLKSEEIIFKISTPNKAAILVPGQAKKDEDVLMLIMPVRLN